MPGSEYLRGQIEAITARVAAGFISAESAADQIMKLISGHVHDAGDDRAL